MTNDPSDDTPPNRADDPTDAVDGPADGRDGGDAMVRRAAQRYGFSGAMLAGGMVAFDRLLGRREQEDPPVIAEAPDEPVDIDRELATMQDLLEG